MKATWLRAVAPSIGVAAIVLGGLSVGVAISAPAAGWITAGSATVSAGALDPAFGPDAPAIADLGGRQSGEPMLAGLSYH